MDKKIISIVLGSTLLILFGFQNCSPVQFETLSGGQLVAKIDQDDADYVPADIDIPLSEDLNTNSPILSTPPATVPPIQLTEGNNSGPDGNGTQGNTNNTNSGDGDGTPPVVFNDPANNTPTGGSSASGSDDDGVDDGNTNNGGNGDVDVAEDDEHDGKKCGDKSHGHVHDGANGDGNRHLCILNSSKGNSVKLGLANNKFGQEHATTRAVCISAKACLGVVSKKFPVRGVSMNGVCQHNKNVVHLTDDEVITLLEEE
ncbi:MAG: hypothetical protein KDD50_14450 [Bdellovibrionales bacterium]|nr:hypothetical protein [Bdellovibrionales bacterium]